jgi:hypothetical protein
VGRLRELGWSYQTLLHEGLSLVYTNYLDASYTK